MFYKMCKKHFLLDLIPWQAKHGKHQQHYALKLLWVLKLKKKKKKKGIFKLKFI